MRLNPFAFRANTDPQILDSLAEKYRLNPFAFRANTDLWFLAESDLAKESQSLCFQGQY